MAKTAYLYDPVYLEHETDWGHPESASRLGAIHRKICSSDYFKELVQVEPAAANFRYLERIHSRQYIERVKDEIENGIAYLDSMDTSVCSRSYEVALLAAGGCLNVCDTIMDGRTNAVSAP